MRYGNLYIAGLGSWYPKPEPVAAAVADGRYDEALWQRTGQQSVAVAGPEDTQPEMAVRAGAAAVRQCGLPTAEFGLLLHAVAGHNGLDGWNAASFLQHRLLAGNGVGFQIGQLSNGGTGALELAAAYLATRPDRGSAALITAADIFLPPVWDRWRIHPGLVFGDGASALVLSTRGGFARIASVVTVSRPELEGMVRGDLPFQPNPDPRHHPVNLIARFKAYAQREIGMPEITARMDAALVEAATTAAAEAGITPPEADHVILPHFGTEMLRRECLDPLGVDIERSCHRWGQEVGHAGATDQFGAMDWLARTGRLGAGHRVLMIGIGGGFNWTAAVMEVTGDMIPS